MVYNILPESNCAMTLFFDKQTVAHVDDLLPLYGRREFASPTRSTVPLFSLLKQGAGVWTRIAQLVAGEVGSIEVHVEYTVAPPKGKGRQSHTDVMLRNGDCAGALEAKWTEPRYPTVQEWLNAGANLDNRRAVMNGWLSLLETRVGRALHLQNFDNAVYQMVHRSASACAVGRPAVMAYLQFSPLPDNQQPNVAQLESDLLYFRALLGSPVALPFYLFVVEIELTEAFRKISGLAKGLESTATTVQEALHNGPLFIFKGYRRVL
jgi:hypothetical protein